MLTVITVMKMVSYGEVFRKAWEEVLKDWEGGIISLDREADFTHHLFAKCLKVMSDLDMPTPYQIHAEETYTTPDPKEWHKPVDIVLGESETLIEVKFNRSLYTNSVQRDIDKLIKLMNFHLKIKRVCFVAVFNATGYGEGIVDVIIERDFKETVLKNSWPKIRWKQVKVGKKDFCALLTQKER